ncbi:YD repeat-containing protein [Variovorax sp. YR752]|uniref:DUF6531 domain-containing protein n=1 Tax=Variovorax sp. YR752 TaxID=1884383 RepID=UPI000BDD629B|nr:DUF6531 domain-containing protein [Variovorax sp. YR752]SOE06293.1 YD repeat-containing protein [Variovorax sp. YR752]
MSDMREIGRWADLRTTLSLGALVRKISVAFLCALSLAAIAQNDWTIDNSQWDGYYPKTPFSSPSSCKDAAVSAWHARWPGYPNTTVTLTEARPEHYGWVLDGGTRGGFGCSRPSCPTNSSRTSSNQCQCNVGFEQSGSSCRAIEPETGNSCRAGSSFGNPILASSAEKYQVERDFTDVGVENFEWTRIYRSSWRQDLSDTGAALGGAWSHSHNWRVKVYEAVGGKSAVVESGSGERLNFSMAATASTWSALGNPNSLESSSGNGWTLRLATGEALHFSASGKLTSRVATNGWTTNYNYINDRLTQITSQFGRVIEISYDGNGRIGGLALPGARSVSYSYDASGRLTTVTYPDGKSKTYLYENAGFLELLTGVLGEDGIRLSTYTYDSQARATRTEHAAGADAYQVGYPTAGTAVVTDPIATSRTYTYGFLAGKLAVGSSSLPPGDGRFGAATQAQDSSGLITSETDFKGVVTTTNWDTTRRLPTAVEYAAGTPDARIVTTQWHPTFSLPVFVTAPREALPTPTMRLATGCPRP